MSILNDIEDTIEALSYLNDLDSNMYGELNQKDLDALIKFLIDNQSGVISVRQE